jgi:hypothetical protein
MLLQEGLSPIPQPCSHVSFFCLAGDQLLGVPRAISWHSQFSGLHNCAVLNMVALCYHKATTTPGRMCRLEKAQFGAKRGILSLV